MEDPPTAPYSPPSAAPGRPVTPPSATPPPAAAPPPAAPPPSGTPPPPAWREPPWIPPRAERGPNFSLIFGVIILLVGLWFFAGRTLGLDLPDISWSQLWPLLLIGLGAWIVYGAMRRNR